MDIRTLDLDKIEEDFGVEIVELLMDLDDLPTGIRGGAMGKRIRDQLRKAGLYLDDPSTRRKYVVGNRKGFNRPHTKSQKPVKFHPKPKKEDTFKITLIINGKEHTLECQNGDKFEINL